MNSFTVNFYTDLDPKTGEATNVKQLTLTEEQLNDILYWAVLVCGVSHEKDPIIPELREALQAVGALPLDR